MGVEYQLAETPQNPIEWKDFEKIVLQRLDDERKDGLCHIKKYGIQATPMGGEGVSFQNRWKPVKSKPDFEGPFDMSGCQAVFDAKVLTSRASFPLTDYMTTDDKIGSKEIQFKHMYGRSQFGCPCGFLIHWNARETKTKSEIAVTCLFPIQHGLGYWEDFFAGDRRSITRDDCFGDRGYSVPVKWNVRGKDRTVRPDVLQAVRQLKRRLQTGFYDRLEGRDDNTVWEDCPNALKEEIEIPDFSGE